MKKDRWMMALSASLIFFLMFACRPPEATEVREDEPTAAAPVKLYRVKRQRISEKLSFTGVIEAWKKVNITPDIGGKIAKIYVQEGDFVKKGELVAEMDTRTIRLQLEQAEAGFAVAEANYKDAKRNMDRMERLKKENAVSEQQYEQVRLAFEAAEAQLQQARAALNLARHNLDVSLMKAPFNGIVASKNAEEGDVINPMMGGFSPTSGVLTLMDFSRVKIEIDVSQEDIAQIKKGQEAFLRVRALPEKVFPGRVTLVNLTADPLTKKFRVQIMAENPDLLLKPNTFGEVILEVSTREDALVIPQRAIIENRYVFVAQENNTVVRKEVRLGLQNTEMAEVVDGIEEGDLVVVEGNFGLEDGASIKVEEVVQ
ncbi:MAG: efflux RND transporter periplasmic adaptor subunit [Candidatus Aminicenantales bacterium]